jgi:hypothetical protein
MINCSSKTLFLPFWILRLFAPTRELKEDLPTLSMCEGSKVTDADAAVYGGTLEVS